MGLLITKKSSKNIKLDDYTENKIANVKKIVKNNKTLITFSLFGCIYYIYKLYFYTQ